MRGQAAEDERAIGHRVPVQLRDPVDRDDRRRQRLATLAGGDDEIRSAGDRAAAASLGEDREGVLDRRRTGEPLGHRGPDPAAATAVRAASLGPNGAFASPAPSSPVVIARQTRSGVIGRRRTRTPVRGRDRVRDRGGRRHDRRLADALRAARPAVRGGMLDEDRLDLGRVGARQELVVEQRGVALAAVRAVAPCPRASRCRGPSRPRRSSGRSAPVALRTRPTSVAATTFRARTMPVAGSRRTRAAWQKNVGEENDSNPSRPTQADASCSGSSGGMPEPRARSSAPFMGRRREIRDRDPPVGAADDAGVPVAQLEVLDRCLQGDSAASSRSCRRTSRAASTTARPLLNVVWLPELPPSNGPAVGVLVGDREVLGPHARAPRRQGSPDPSRPRCRSPGRR